MLTDILVLFPITNLVIIQLSFLLGVQLSAFHTILSLPVCFCLAYWWQPRRNLRDSVTAAFLFFALAALAVVLSVAFVDAYYDSRSYHGPAVIALSDGWNPLHDPHLCEWDVDYCVPTHTIIDHYPKAQWHVAAGLYAIFGDIDTGKSFGLLQLVLCFLVSLEFAGRLFPEKSFAPFVWAAVAAVNPVAVAQLFTGYVDGLMASTFALYALLLSSYVFFADRKSLYRAALVLPYLVNIKFTGLVYAAVFTGLMIVMVVLRRGRSPRRLLSITLASGVASVTVLGFNPYVVNFVEQSNPFFPARQGSFDVLKRQVDPGFMAKTRIEKFVIAQFSVPDEEQPRRPVWSVPLSRLKTGTEVDRRFSGFGAFFSALGDPRHFHDAGLRNERPARAAPGVDRDRDGVLDAGVLVGETGAAAVAGGRPGPTGLADTVERETGRDHHGGRAGDDVHQLVNARWRDLASAANPVGEDRPNPRCRAGHGAIDRDIGQPGRPVRVLQPA
jgi:hypothetical protein